MNLLKSKSAEERYEENPNPKAKIGFVIFYPFQFYVFKNVYVNLKEEAEFIIDDGRFFPLESPPGLSDDCAVLLSKYGVYFRILRHCDYQNPKYLAEFLARYDALASLWWSGCLDLPQAKNVRKVHMNYGAGKELTMFWTWHRRWDLYLCLGPRVYEIIKFFTWVEIIGYPKFDDWFNNEFDKNFIAEIEKKFNLSKKTILYLPTHGDLSSIDDLDNEFKKAALSYNVIVKFHYYTPREEPERVKKLQHPGIIFFQDDTDLLPLLKISDIVVSDNSSAIFEAVLADKPLVVTDFLSEEYLNKGHKKLKSFHYRLPEGALTYSQSIEQKIKKDGSVVVIRKPAEFKEAIERALADGRHFQDARKKLREEIFAFNDGKCGERAAASIKKLISLERLPEKPILYHVFEAEASRSRGYMESTEVSDISYYFRYREFSKIRAMPIHKRIAAIIKGFF